MRLASKAKAAGYNALAFQLDYPTPSGVSTSALWGLFYNACVAYDVLPGVWVTQPWHWPMTPPESRFLVVEDERPDQRAAILGSLADMQALGIPLGVVTNGHYAPERGQQANRAEWAPIAAAGFAYLGEVYARTDAGVPTGQKISDMQYRATIWQGVEANKTAPVYGLFGGAVYDPAERAAQAAYWDWPVEGRIVNA